MDTFYERTEKQENALTKILRKIIKQKDDSLRKYKIENDDLKQIVLKQQALVNRLNDENIKLSQDLIEMKKNSIDTISNSSKNDRHKDE
jgi:hypothetical protein